MCRQPRPPCVSARYRANTHRKRGKRKPLFSWQSLLRRGGGRRWDDGDRRGTGDVPNENAGAYAPAAFQLSCSSNWFGQRTLCCARTAALATATAVVGKPTNRPRDAHARNRLGPMHCRPAAARQEHRKNCPLFARNIHPNRANTPRSARILATWPSRGHSSFWKFVETG